MIVINVIAINFTHTIGLLLSLLCLILGGVLITIIPIKAVTEIKEKPVQEKECKSSISIRKPMLTT